MIFGVGNHLRCIRCGLLIVNYRLLVGINGSFAPLKTKRCTVLHDLNLFKTRNFQTSNEVDRFTWGQQFFDVGGH